MIHFQASSFILGNKEVTELSWGHIGEMMGKSEQLYDELSDCLGYQEEKCFEFSNLAFYKLPSKCVAFTVEIKEIKERYFRCP